MEENGSKKPLAEAYSSSGGPRCRKMMDRRPHSPSGCYPSPWMSDTRISRVLHAAPSAVYAALIDPDAVAVWMVPDGMRSIIHHFDAREGGAFRITLTYDRPTGTGKTTSQSDSYHGTFVSLVRDHEVIQEMEFETDDSSMQGRMRVEFHLASVDDGTRLDVAHRDLPPGVSTADNDVGWQMALDKLERLTAPDAS